MPADEPAISGAAASSDAVRASDATPPGDATPAADATPSGDPTLPGAHRHRACVVAIGGRRLAVDVREAREVMTVDAIGTVPGAPAPLLGVANLRGTVVAVADARSVLGLPPTPRKVRGAAIVLAAGGLEAAVPIDGVLGLEWFDAPLPVDDLADGPLKTFAAGLVPRADEPAILLDAARLLEALCAPWAPAAVEAQP
ncbi:MAG TPA: chemotaxis protein CheW [Methylomirabilota bacterium]